MSLDEPERKSGRTLEIGIAQKPGCLCLGSRLVDIFQGSGIVLRLDLMQRSGKDQWDAADPVGLFLRVIEQVAARFHALLGEQALGWICCLKRGRKQS